MKITDLLIGPRSLGKGLWLVDVTPAYEYKDNKRTNNVTAFRYSVCMVDKNLEKINIKIEGKKLMGAPESGYVEVSRTGLEVFVYLQNNQPNVGAHHRGKYFPHDNRRHDLYRPWQSGSCPFGSLQNSSVSGSG